MTDARASDLGRRIGYRRRELGLSREQVADRAGVDADYLDYLERSPAAAIPLGSLFRLASALETTVEALLGGEIDRPPGPGLAGPRPLLEELDRAECEAHIAAGGVGRFVFLAGEGPIAVPVNFRFIDGDVVFRTRAEGVIAAARGTRVSFEVDHIDEAMSEGWSVLIGGRAQLIDDPIELERIAAAGIEPWTGGPREAVIRIKTETISGRRIRQAGRRRPPG